MKIGEDESVLSTAKKKFFVGENPENIFTIFTAVVLGALVHTNLWKNRLFLRIDIEKVKQSEHLLF